MKKLVRSLLTVFWLSTVVALSAHAASSLALSTDARLCLEGEALLFILDEYRDDIVEFRSHKDAKVRRALTKQLELLDRTFLQVWSGFKKRGAQAKAHKDTWLTLSDRAQYDYDGYHCDLETIRTDPADLLEASSKTFTGKTPRQLLADVRHDLLKGPLNPLVRYEFALADAEDEVVAILAQYNDSGDITVARRLSCKSLRDALPADPGSRKYCAESLAAMDKLSPMIDQLLKMDAAKRVELSSKPDDTFNVELRRRSNAMEKALRVLNGLLQANY